MLRGRGFWLKCWAVLLPACHSGAAESEAAGGGVTTETGVTSAGGAPPASQTASGSSAAGAGGADAGSGGDAALGAAGAVGDPGVPCSARLSEGSWAVRFADMVISRYTSPREIMGEQGLFQYNSGIVLRGLWEVYKNTCDARYAEYIRRYVDAAVDDAGHLNIPQEHNFDNLQPAVLLPFLYGYSGDERYQVAAREVLDRYASMPKNAEGGYWHKQNYPNELWCDTIYVGMTPLIEYARGFDDCGSFCLDEAVDQALLLAEHAQLGSGLMLHAYDGDANAAWADASGVSPEVWGRANGWYLMAAVELLAALPRDHARRGELLDVVTLLAGGLERAQDASGLWFQVLDKGGQAGNFLETSSSGMFVYALDLAVENGDLPESFRDVAAAGWSGLLAEGRILDNAGVPEVSGAVEGMGVQTSYALYVNKQTLVNSSHGLIAALLASVRMAE